MRRAHLGKMFKMFDVKRTRSPQAAARSRAGQGLDLLETRGWADRASGVIEA